MKARVLRVHMSVLLLSTDCRLVLQFALKCKHDRLQQETHADVDMSVLVRGKLLALLAAQVNHRFVTTLKEDGDQRIYWKTLQVRQGAAWSLRQWLC